MASIKDVALKAGVSIATVSRMMAGKGYVSEETKERVQAAIDELGYRPNRVAQSLREQKSRIIGLIVSDIQNPFFGELCRAVEGFAHARGLCVFICNTDEDPAKEQRYLELMMQERVAGVIISPSHQGAGRLAALTKAGIPVVTVDRREGRELDAVLIDNQDAARHLAERVIAGGYRRIAGIFGASSFTAGERLAGFEAALAAAGLTPHAVKRVPAFEAEGRAAMEALLGAGERPDAVVCSSALLATGAYRALHAARISIPDTMGFACFDDPPWATFVSPALTVVRQPAAMIGVSAAELLLKRIAEPARGPSVLRLQGALIERGSLR
ncbi:MAG: LacI family DNA-binding transcriptional regulator [Verrucomicrobiota bacterium]